MDFAPQGSGKKQRRAKTSKTVKPGKRKRSDLGEHAVEGDAGDIFHHESDEEVRRGGVRSPKWHVRADGIELGLCIPSPLRCREERDALRAVDLHKRCVFRQ